MSEIRITGGCQCGAVRYALTEQPDGAHICHCRMCQKAFGSFFAPFVGVELRAFGLTHGELSVFKSSDPTERGFCRNCGTPLTIHDTHSSRIGVSIGSFDEPERFEPQYQCGIESRLSWFHQLPGLPSDKTTADENPDFAARVAASNHQHPDHDTDRWPVGKGR